MEEQVSEVEREVVITDNNLLFHFGGHNNDLLILKQWKGALNRIVLSLLSILKSNKTLWSVHFGVVVVELIVITEE